VAIRFCRSTSCWRANSAALLLPPYAILFDLRIGLIVVAQAAYQACPHPAVSQQHEMKQHFQITTFHRGRKLLLPLVGGGIHDWNWMLEHLGWLSYTKSIAGMIRLVGTFTIFIAAILSIYFALHSPPDEFEEI